MKYFILLSILFLIKSSHSQESEIISQFRNELDTVRNEKEKGILYRKMGYVFRNENIDSFSFYTHKGRRYSQQANDTTNVGLSLQNLSSAYAQHALFDSSNYYSEYAAKVFLSVNNHSKYIASRSNVGLNHWKSGKHDDGIKLYTELIAYSDSLNILSEKPRLYNNIGLILNAVGNKELALHYYTEGLAIAKKLDDLRGVALFSNNLSIIYRHNQEFEKANELIKNAIDASEKIKFNPNIIRGYSNLGANYTKMELFQKAERAFYKSLSLRSNVKPDMQLVKTYCHMGELYLAEQKYDLARSYTQKSLAIADSLGIPEDRRYAYEQLLEIEILSKNSQKALIYIDSLDFINVQIQKEQLAEELAESSAKLKLGRIQDSLSLVMLENTNLQLTQTQTNLRGLLLFGVLLLVGLIYYFNNRRRMYLSIAETEQAATMEMNRHLEDYKQQMSSKLHDEIGQQLAILSLSLENSEVNSRSIIDETIGLVRETSKSMYPYQLKRLGINKTVQEMVKNINLSGIIKFTADLSEMKGIFDGEEELQVFRIVQEASNNALKHSKAKNVNIEFSKDSKTLKIIDNGIGPDNIPSVNKGIGLIAMRAKANKLNAKLEIVKNATGGTSVVLVFN